MNYITYTFIIFISIIFVSCGDSVSPPAIHTLSINNDLPVQVKFYVDGKIKIRIDGKSLEPLELEDGTYEFSITSPSFNDCNPLNSSLCTPVFNALLDTVISFNRDMTATIEISLFDRLSDADFYHVELSFK